MAISTQYRIRVTATRLLLALACILLCWRLWWVIDGLHRSDETALLEFPFSVVLPFVLIVALCVQKPTNSREGVLMRVGAIVHLLLIIALPWFALYLALGFPFVALVVELFETQAPPAWRDRLGRVLIRC